MTTPRRQALLGLALAFFTWVPATTAQTAPSDPSSTPPPDSNLSTTISSPNPDGTFTLWVETAIPDFGTSAIDVEYDPKTGKVTIYDESLYDGDRYTSESEITSDPDGGWTITTTGWDNLKGVALYVITITWSPEPAPFGSYTINRVFFTGTGQFGEFLNPLSGVFKRFDSTYSADTGWVTDRERDYTINPDGSKTLIKDAITRTLIGPLQP